MDRSFAIGLGGLTRAGKISYELVGERAGYRNRRSLANELDLGQRMIDHGLGDTLRARVQNS
jgi:hypothetical protein